MRERLLADLPVSERRFDVDGVDTAVLEGGDGAPVVLLHGVGSFAPEWGRVIPELARSHRVVAPDLPGLGESSVRVGRLDVAAAVAWLQSLIAQTCAEPPMLVGHSVGGALAAHFAIQHGDSVGRIVLVDCSSLGRFRPAPGVAMVLVRYGARPSPASRDRFLRRVLADPERARTEWGHRWAALEAYDLDQATRPSVDAANRELVRRIGARRIASDQLRGINVPVALIWGRGPTGSCASGLPRRAASGSAGLSTRSTTAATDLTSNGQRPSSRRSEPPLPPRSARDRASAMSRWVALPTRSARAHRSRRRWFAVTRCLGAARRDVRAASKPGRRCP
ncbi:MAG: alpha/beta fold hydrolase [Gaiellaceae bacterium]